MNYYEKHIGDFIRDTVSLSMLEDGAYNRLLDQVYQTERALPLDKKEVYRVARATSPVERKAVDYVLGKFFHLTEDGYMQKRAQVLIEEFWDREPAKESKRESAKVRQQRSRARRQSLFDQLREHGVVPEFNTSSRQLEVELSRVTERDSHKLVTRDDTLTQTPDTTPQSPIIKTKADDDSTDSGTASSFPPARDPDLDPPRAAPLPMREHPPLSNDPAVVISVALRRLHVNANSMHPAVQDWANRGVSLELLTEAVTIARETKGNAAIPPNYLVPIVHGLLNPPALSEVKPGKARDDWEWVKSDAGIQRKANELGIRAHGSMSYRDLADKCKAEIQRRKGASQ